MNKGTTTENRLSWTIPALNFCLEVSHDIAKMRRAKKDGDNNLVKGTSEDANKLSEYIENLVGGHRLFKRKKFNVNFWYQNRENNLKGDTLLSQCLEHAWNKVGDYYIKHQHAIHDDKSSEVMIVDNVDNDEFEIEEEDLLYD